MGHEWFQRHVYLLNTATSAAPPPSGRLPLCGDAEH